jgi:hypothetical protein
MVKFIYKPNQPSAQALKNIIPPLFHVTCIRGTAEGTAREERKGASRHHQGAQARHG